jgi:hypothetical protein
VDQPQPLILPIKRLSACTLIVNMHLEGGRPKIPSRPMAAFSTLRAP